MLFMTSRQVAERLQVSMAHVLRLVRTNALRDYGTTLPGKKKHEVKLLPADIRAYIRATRKTRNGSAALVAAPPMGAPMERAAVAAPPMGAPMEIFRKPSTPANKSWRLEDYLQKVPQEVSGATLARIEQKLDWLVSVASSQGKTYANGQ